MKTTFIWPNSISHFVGRVRRSYYAHALITHTLCFNASRCHECAPGSVSRPLGDAAIFVVNMRVISVVFLWIVWELARFDESGL